MTDQSGIEADLQRIQRRWLSIGTAVREGASDETISAFEQHYRVRLPIDVEQYYALMDGMDNCETDDDLICFWPLHELGTVPEKLSSFRGVPDYSGIEFSLPEADSYFVFADHSIWIHVYAAKFSTDADAASPVVWIGGGDRWQELAGSFREFIHLYAINPEAVAYP
jgi:hypothetical protein